MHENVAKLYPNPDTSAKVMDYSVAKSTPLPDWLLKYHQWGRENTAVPNFLTSTYQAQMLVFLAKMVGAKRGESLRLQQWMQMELSWLWMKLDVSLILTDW